ncbi:hypothetical protein TrispH2_009962 [Trichoplax sp. H2]|nr:hypothetical protein TrispH2_009962 [Trichoplax sp. H2]|eukprot:RDD38329.1 hypothetical protein TrispH2_009962 [Trichoplax sp. H2]
MESFDGLDDLFSKLSLESLNAPFKSSTQDTKSNKLRQDGSLLDKKNPLDINNQPINQDSVNQSKKQNLTNLEVMSPLQQKCFIKTVPFGSFQVGSNIKIEVLAVINPNYFFVRDRAQMNEEMKTSYQQLQAKMKKLYQQFLPRKRTWCCGDIGVARLKIDGEWHRVMLDTIGKTHAEVHCIDTGYYQQVSLKDCFPLYSCLASRKAMAVACSLDNVDYSPCLQYWPMDVTQLFSSWLKSHHVTMKVSSRQDDIHFVQIEFYQLTECFHANTELLKCKWAITRCNHLQSQSARHRIHHYQRILRESQACSVPLISIPRKKWIDVYATAIVSPSLFWLKFSHNTKASDDHSYKPHANTIAKKNCEVGCVFLIRNKNGTYFRGQLKCLLMYDYALVQDIDSAIVSKVMLKGNLIKLSNAQKRLPATAVQCYLDLVNGDREINWSSSILHQFTSAVNAGKLKALFHTQATDIHGIKLHQMKQTDCIDINRIIEQALIEKDAMDISNNDENLPIMNDNIHSLDSSVCNLKQHTPYLDTLTLSNSKSIDLTSAKKMGQHGNRPSDPSKKRLECFSSLKSSPIAKPKDKLSRDVNNTSSQRNKCMKDTLENGKQHSKIYSNYPNSPNYNHSQRPSDLMNSYTRLPSMDYSMPHSRFTNYHQLNWNEYYYQHHNGYHYRPLEYNYSRLACLERPPRQPYAGYRTPLDERCSNYPLRQGMVRESNNSDPRWITPPYPESGYPMANNPQFRYHRFQHPSPHWMMTRPHQPAWPRPQLGMHPHFPPNPPRARDFSR